MKNWAHDPVASAKNPLRQVSERAYFHVELSISQKTGESVAISTVKHAVTEKEENRTDANCILFQWIISVHHYLYIYFKNHMKNHHTLAWLNTIFSFCQSPQQVLNAWLN